MVIIKLVLVRHGESQRNKENCFAGWCNMGLSEEGVNEAKTTGKLLRGEGYSFGFAYTSVLKHAIYTLWSILDGLNQT